MEGAGGPQESGERMADARWRRSGGGWRARKGPGESRVRREVDGPDGIRGSEGSRRGGGGSEGEVNGPEWTQVGGNSDGSTSWWPHQDLEDLVQNNFKTI